MKKLVFGICFVLVIINCIIVGSTVKAEHITPDFIYPFIYKNDYVIYPTTSQIFIDLNGSITTYCTTYRSKRKLNTEDTYRVARAMELAQKHLGIRYIDLICIMSIESGFNPKAINRNKPTSAGKRTIDYGLLQVNSEEIPNLTKQSKEFLEMWGYKNIPTDNPYHLEMNIIMGAIHFKWFQIQLEKKKIYSLSNHVKTYNCGLNGGVFYQTSYWKKRRENYYDKFMKAQNLFGYTGL